MKTISLYGIATIIISLFNSCGLSNNNSYENSKESAPLLFDGNFKGVVNRINVSVSLINNNGKVTGTYKDPETNYSISGNVDANGNFKGKMSNGLLSFDCAGYYEGYNPVLELDPTFIDLMRIAAAFTNNPEEAITMEGKLVLEKQ